MKRTRWHRPLVAALIAVGLAGGVVWAEEVESRPAATIVLREPGKPDRTCIIEKSTPQADGSVLHDVRDAASGERLRVLDSRRGKGPVGTVMARICGPDSAEIAAAANSNEPRRIPTTAELASYSRSPISPPAKDKTIVISSRAGLFSRNKPQPAPAPKQASPVQEQLTKLKEALGPSEREMAALALCSSDIRTSPQVVAALMEAARSDPAPTVRCCLVRCLHLLSREAPQVVPVLVDMQTDPNDEVKKAAEQAVLEVNKSITSNPKQ